MEGPHLKSNINYQVREPINNDIGQFVLTYSKNTQIFCLHSHIKTDFLSLNNRKAVILSLGFEKSTSCDFFNGDECYYTQFLRVSGQEYQPGFFDNVSIAHYLFKKFTNDFGKICEHAIELRNFIPQGYIQIPLKPYSFQVDPDLLRSKTSFPAWVEKVAPKGQIELRDEILNKMEILKNEYV